jgi:D-glycero-beta-D-manno-heptose-7-phosphate kinase
MTLTKRLLGYLPRFEGKKIAVVGDLYHDEYIMGRPSRISREAPIPVLEFRRRKSVPGGATSPACNVVALGGKAYQIGVIGSDTSGRVLLEELIKTGVEVEGIIIDPNRPTTTKTRIIAEDDHIYPQQVARIDQVDSSPLALPVQNQIMAHLEKLATQVDAILFSDYKCGVVTAPVIEAAKATGRMTTVDSQGDLNKFKGCALVKCNLQDAESFLRRELNGESDFEEAMRMLQTELQAKIVVITRGGDGMSALDETGTYYYAPVTTKSEVFDVTGAGDAVIAVLTLSLAVGVPLPDACHLANCAGQVVIRKLGNVPIELAELEQELEKFS